MWGVKHQWLQFLWCQVPASKKKKSACNYSSEHIAYFSQLQKSWVVSRSISLHQQPPVFISSRPSIMQVTFCQQRPPDLFLISQFSSSSGLAKSERVRSASIKHFLARAEHTEEKGAWHWIPGTSSPADFMQGRRKENVVSFQSLTVEELVFKAQEIIAVVFHDSHILRNESALSL